jgi:hypothetical protein
LLAAATTLAAVGAWAAETLPDLTPQFKPPRAGFPADHTFIVKLPREIAMPCVAVDASTARIAISRKLLDAYAASRRLGPDWKSEAERSAMILGDRARALLRAAKTASGIECGEVVDESALGDAKYLVSALLMSGNAMVIDAKGGRITERLRIHFFANGAGGFSTFYLDRGEMFFHLGTWVS